MDVSGWLESLVFDTLINRSNFCCLGSVLIMFLAAVGLSFGTCVFKYSSFFRLRAWRYGWSILLDSSVSGLSSEGIGFVKNILDSLPFAI